MKQSIIREIKYLLCIENVCWEKVAENSTKNLIKIICDMYNTNKEIMIVEISKLTKISKTTIRDYLKKGLASGAYDYKLEPKCYRRDIRTRLNSENRINKYIPILSKYYRDNNFSFACQVKEQFKNLSVGFISKCLTSGDELGLCVYNKESRMAKLHDFRSKQLKNRRKPVIKVRLDGTIEKEYESLTEAALSAGITNNGLIRHLKNGKPFINYIWKYKNKEE